MHVSHLSVSIKGKAPKTIKQKEKLYDNIQWKGDKSKLISTRFIHIVIIS